MIYVILVLVYLSGIARMFYHSMAVDAWSMIRHGHKGGFNRYTSYLILCVFWPITMWLQMYFRWQQVRDLSGEKPDRSYWMYCSNCIVKWRPTAYGTPAPDDYYCPACKTTEGVKWHVGFVITEVPEFKERSN